MLQISLQLDAESIEYSLIHFSADGSDYNCFVQHVLSLKIESVALRLVNNE